MKWALLGTIALLFLNFSDSDPLTLMYIAFVTH